MTEQAPGSPFLSAARGVRPSRTPVWFMRQAGRALPEYRALREGVAMLDACSDADTVTEITLQPVRRYGVDAAVLFSDIVVPLRAVGVDVDIVPGRGPVLAEPVRTRADVERLRVPDADDVPYVADACRALVAELGDVPLLGFAGAPFTLACYLVEGGPSKDHARTRALMHADPPLWDALLDRLAALTLGFLRVQVDAGAAAVQLFDSWAGVLSRRDYASRVQPWSARVLQGLEGTGVPRVHFGVGTGELLDLLAAAGADVLGVDDRVLLDDAAARVPGVPLQGNLTPVVALADAEVARREALDVLRRGRAAPAHVFNLGHGVLPGSDPGVLAEVVDLVHETDVGDLDAPDAPPRPG